MALPAADGSASDVDDRTGDMLYRDARLRSDCREFRAQPEADPESTDWAKFGRVPFDTSSRLLPAVLRVSCGVADAVLCCSAAERAVRNATASLRDLWAMRSGSRSRPSRVQEVREVGHGRLMRSALTTNATTALPAALALWTRGQPADMAFAFTA